MTMRLRRVCARTTHEREYVHQHNRKWKRRRSPCQEFRRLRPPASSKAMLRSYTLSVPAHAASSPPPHRPVSPGVPDQFSTRDPGLLIASAATNPAISDRQLRVYALVVTVFDRGVDAATVAANMPTLTEAQAGRILGDLASAGLLTVRRRVVGYRDGERRIRRRWYELPPVVLA